MQNLPPAQHTQYAQQPYAPAPYAKPLPTATTVGETNTYALVAIVLAFIVPLLGIIFGHLALSQIKRTGDAGRGLALTGLIFGYGVIVLWALIFIFYISFFAIMIGSLANAF